MNNKARPDTGGYTANTVSTLSLVGGQYAEENTLFFMQGPRGGPRSFYFDVTNVF